MDFRGLLYTIASPVKGTGHSTVWEIVGGCLPWVILLASVFVVLAVIFARQTRVARILRRVGAAVCAVLLVASATLTVYALRIPEYMETKDEDTPIYDYYYVDPRDVAISADGKTKNLIYIYLESMETTYASSDIGGGQTDNANYIPNLSALVDEGVTFTNKDEGLLGGFRPISGTTWTIASLLATSSGIPFAFPVGSNSMSKQKTFAEDLVALGDILEEKGYRQEFLCGSDASFGGRRNYFEQHGNYEIFDLFTAREEGYIAEDYYVWWGYEDNILFDIAKNELIELAAGDEPFNFTMLTVDAHHVDGYVCSECGSEYGNRLQNVLTCTDRLVSEFVSWCQTQDFYEDSVIIISGDHPRMDSNLVGHVEMKNRTMYNCILNCDTPVAAGAASNREYTAMDMFPTTLAAVS